MEVETVVTPQESPIEISVIVPLHNEEECVRPLYEALTRALSRDYELLLVDDGSYDQTFAIAAGLAQADPRLRVVKLRRNYGQTPAMAAGIEQARGRILVTMDGDLQNDPEDIPPLVDKISEGYDIVAGWRHQRHDRFLTRKLPSKIANWLIGKVTGVPIKDNGCSLKAYRSEVIKQVPLYSDLHRFIPAMASITGARTAQLKVRHHPRRLGVSKYGLLRTYKVLLDLFAVKTVMSFAERPLWWFSLLAWPAVLISLGAMVAVVLEVSSGNYSVVTVGVALLFGVIAIFAVLGGIMGEMIYKTGNLKLADLALITSTHDGVHDEDHRVPRS